MKEFVRLRKEAEGFADGIVYSAKPVNDEQLKKLESETGKLIGKRIRLENIIDGSLIGGVKIVADGKLIDASIRSRLNRLYAEIKDM